MSIQANTKRRNIVTLAIAPTMSISNLCNLTSSGIEPWITNAFSKKLKQGTFAVQNKYLKDIIREYADENDLDSHWIDEQWVSIKKYDGSVQHLEWMNQNDKDVFKTAFEIDQRWVIEHAGDRSGFIDQGQSVNLFIPGNSHVQFISDLHILAWKKGLKSLYYLRSTNPNKASTGSAERKTIGTDTSAMMEDTCLACT
jgi:ribonucleoside-diphosphate reductase alpha chain